MSVLAGALLLACAPAAADANHPETWLTVSGDAPLSPVMYLRVSEEARASASTVYYTHTDLDLNWATKTLQLDTAGLGVRYARVRRTPTWVDQGRVYLHGTANWKVGSLRIDDRSTFEYQLESSSFGRWRYRNRVGFYLPVGHSATLYLTDELSVRLDRLQAYRNRLAIGARGKVTPGLEVDLYVQRQTTRKDSEDEGEIYERSSAVGGRLRFRF